jgi:hypothetical protein
MNALPRNKLRNEEKRLPEWKITILRKFNDILDYYIDLSSKSFVIKLGELQRKFEDALREAHANNEPNDSIFEKYDKELEKFIPMRNKQRVLPNKK